MRPAFRAALIGAAAVGLVALAWPAQALTTQSGATDRQSCGAAPAPGSARCLAVVRTAGGVTAFAATPAGYGPGTLQSAYGLPSSTKGGGATVAIVDAFDDPKAEADLAVYRSHYGLPACTTAGGCFRKVNQTGGTSYPKADGGWAQEISLDLDMVSAICPKCRILLVEAKSASFADLGAAVNEAAKLGATAISNSYGGPDASDSSYGSYYHHPGIAITASSGDGGYGVEYPASSHWVTAVGGTSLRRSANVTRGWVETAWSGAGSGCSKYNAAIAGASGTGCGRRAVADVAAVADPATGVAVYDSYAFQGSSGWLTFGGTSVSAPIIASVYALAGNAASIDNTYPYHHTGSLYDVTGGSNGSCPTSQWCRARKGWDGPTGLGTPHGTGAF
jgi:subtilase family serine protease